LSPRASPRVRASSLLFVLIAASMVAPVATASSHTVGTVVPLPSGVQGPVAIVPDGSGQFWITADQPPTLFRFDPVNRTFTERVPLPKAEGAEYTPAGSLWGLGSDGAGGLWISSVVERAVYHVQGGIVRKVADVNGTMLFLAPDPKGGAWVGNFQGDQILHVTDDGVAASIATPEASGPAGGGFYKGKLHVVLTTGAAVAEVDAGSRSLKPVLTNLSLPWGFLATGDRAWVAEHGGNSLVTSDGKRFLLPGSPQGEAGLPLGIADDGAGGAWVSVHTVGLLAHVKADGATTAYNVPGGLAANGLSIARHGNLVVMPLFGTARVLVVDPAKLPAAPPAPKEPPITVKPGETKRGTVGLDGPAPKGASLLPYVDAARDAAFLQYEGGPVNEGANAAAFAVRAAPNAPEGDRSVAACLHANGAELDRAPLRLTSVAGQPRHQSRVGARLQEEVSRIR
jgi:streptogramin lyase